MGFLDKLRDTVSVEEVSKKVTDTTNMMKLNNQMKNNEKEIDRLTFQAGRQPVRRSFADRWRTKPTPAQGAAGKMRAAQGSAYTAEIR